MVECPFCESENAYFNGLEYECPECGRVWDCEEIDITEAEYEDE